MARRDPSVLRLCFLVIRLFGPIVPGRWRRDWRAEWEAEFRHHHESLRTTGTLDWRGNMNLVRRAFGALPDAAWLRRQFTTDADVVHDLRHAMRMLRSAPSFTLAAVGILALGLGGTLAVATLLDTLLFRPLPYADVERVVTLWQRMPGGEVEDVAPANFLDWRERSRSFDGLAAVVPYSYDYTGAGEPEVFFGAQVTERFFELIGVQPLLGRTFIEDEHARGGRRAAMITHGLWQRRFGADPSIIDRAVSLDGVPHTIVGVLPPDFGPQLVPRPGELSVWAPKVIQEHEPRIRGTAWWNVVGRLRPGVTLEDARAEMAAIAGALGTEHPRTNARTGVVVVPLREHLMGGVRVPLLLMLAAVVIVLAIGCANVASLLLARGMAREREFAIRAALGAGRGRLVRQLVMESVALSSLSAAIGLLLARWLIGGIVALAPAGVLRLQEAALDGRMLLLVVPLILATALGFGVIPAFQFSRPGRDVMRERHASAPRRTVRRALVMAEVALAVVLLTCAGLLLRSFDRLLAVDPGFSPRNTVALQVFASDRNPTADRVRGFFRETLSRIESLPGVASAGAVSAMPFALANIDIQSPVEVVGRPAGASGDAGAAYLTIATPGFFRTLAVPLREGRLLEATDMPGTPRVAVISDALRRRDWPGESPVGSRIRLQWQGQPLEVEIVGVVSEIRHEGLDSNPRPEVFLPLEQVPFASMTYVVRGSGDPGHLIDASRQAIWSVDPQQPFYSTASVERLVSDSVVRHRFSATLVSAFAAAALLLSAIGIYGVISFAAAQRTREIGVRMALGADRGSIRRMVLREGTGVVAAGIVSGIGVSLIATRYLQSLLFEIPAIDPLTLGVVCLALTAVALMASYVPARRATRVDPVTALRTE